jgi:hypothetical protein
LESKRENEMILNLEVSKAEDHYAIAEQDGSNYKASRVLHQAESADAARQWLIEQGASAEEIDEAFAGFANGEQVFVEIQVAGESEGFPKQ